ncbi:MAG TPA: hypothetical protein VEQ84_04425, partial [Vicinamibacteria bacterium]|nr:hypothetical protein [Vicinamibacteria bacterium]
MALTHAGPRVGPHDDRERIEWARDARAIAWAEHPGVGDAAIARLRRSRLTGIRLRGIRARGRLSRSRLGLTSPCVGLTDGLTFLGHGRLLRDAHLPLVR